MQKLSMDALGRLSKEAFKQTEKHKIIVVLDNVRSMHNVGSIFRTADAFLIEAIYLCGFTPQPPHRDIHKTALGSTETVAWQYFEQTEFALNELKSKQYSIVAVEQVTGSISLENFTWTNDKPIALILGNEVDGVAQNIISQCEHCIEIPQMGTKHSLNISVAAGIVLWQLIGQTL